MWATAIVAVILSALSASVEGKKCNADNCARAATGTFRGLQASRLSACSSFQQCVVTVPVTTITVTTTAAPYVVSQTIITGTTTVTETDVLAVVPTPANARRAEYRARDDSTTTFIPATGVETTPVTSCPSAVPIEASACSGTSRYQSACSCAGITKSYATVAAETVMETSYIPAAIPTVTTTVAVVETDTITIYSTETLTPRPSPTGFRLHSYGDHPMYAFVKGTRAERILALTDSKEESDIFHLGTEGKLRWNEGNLLALVRPNNTNTEFIFYDDDQAALFLSEGLYDPVTCKSTSAHPGTWFLECQASNGRDVLVMCDANQGGTAALDIPYIRLAQSVPDGCTYYDSFMEYVYPE